MSAISSPLDSSVLVLNKLYMAIKMINARRAFVLLAKDFAEVIAKNNGHFDNYRFGQWLAESNNGHSTEDVEFVHTPNLRIMVPRVIRLMAYDRMPRRDLKFNRRNLLARDENQCQYCGKKYPAAALSIDHVIPRSKRGPNTWENMVSCCSKCNTKKGGRSPEEAGMKLIRRPAAPAHNPWLKAKITEKKYSLWKEFITDKTLNIS